MSKDNKKDVTCAVRIPKSLYDHMSEAADLAGLNMSDLMRSAFVDKIQSIRDEEVQKRIKAEKVRNQLEEMIKDSPDSEKRVNDILRLLDSA
tara:strand:- start:517 stop:792 length:276 start_codon:yes stop_codon:yes gene_type:complete